MLNKGLGFAIYHKKIPSESIISCIEDGIKKLDEVDKQRIRQDCALIMRKSKPPKRNLSPKKLMALKKLRNNENIVI